MMHFAKAASILGFHNFFPPSAPTDLHLREKFAAHMESESLSFGTKEEYEFRFEIFQKTEAEITFMNQN